MPALVVFTDLDGTLLGVGTFSFEAAQQGLRALRANDIPLVLVSSKTRTEIEPIRRELNCQHPFVVENGGAVFVPSGYFQFPLNGAQEHGGYQVIEFGLPYKLLRQVLTDIRNTLGGGIRGFGDMSTDEVAALTGLTPVGAQMAMQREYDEPFVIEGPPGLLDQVRKLAEARGLSCSSGGQFHHLMGRTDKGRACRYLIECYRRQFSARAHPLTTVALGDSENDLPMLAAVETPILIGRPDGSHEPAIDLLNVTRVAGIGPVGWNTAIMDLLGVLSCGPRGDE